MNQETDTPQTDEIETVYEQQRESVGGIIEHARELERELNAAMQAIRDIYANEYNSSETYTICERILPKKEHLHQ